MAKEIISLFGEGLIVGLGIWGVFLTGALLLWLVLFWRGLLIAEKEIDSGWG